MQILGIAYQILGPSIEYLGLTLVSGNLFQGFWTNSSDMNSHQKIILVLSNIYYSISLL